MTADHLTALNKSLVASAYHLGTGNLPQAAIANGWSVGIVRASESGTPPPPPPGALELPPGVTP